MRALAWLSMAVVTAALLLVGGPLAPQPANYFEGNTSRLVIGGTQTVLSGGVVNAESGAVINVKTGAALQFNAVDKTSALAAGVSTPVAGVAAGYVAARGETALDGSNPTPVTTGLTTIVACTLTVKLATAPGVGTSVVTYGTSSGTLNLYGWKPTSNADPTLVASTGTETIGWICVGT